MSKKGLYATAAGTVACALAIGYVMQETGEMPGTKPAPVLAPAPVEQATLAPQHGVIDLDLDGISLTSAPNTPGLGDLLDPIVGLAAFNPDVPAPDMPDLETPQLGCEVSATAAPAPMASVALSIDAPCNRNQRVTIHHTGMMVTETTDEDGALSATFPALSPKAVFIVEFEDGMGTVVTADVPELKEFDRVVLQWQGDSGFQIHAREFGAAYGTPGHVWSGDTAQADAGGAVMQLGARDTLTPYLAEVYTYPTGSSQRDGSVALTVEAEVTQVNCGRDIAAQTIELRGGMSPQTQDLVLSMPDCAARGDFLVLNNLLDDLKIAAK